jgi:hypothetical protein
MISTQAGQPTLFPLPIPTYIPPSPYNGQFNQGQNQMMGHQANYIPALPTNFQNPPHFNGLQPYPNLPPDHPLSQQGVIYPQPTQSQHEIMTPSKNLQTTEKHPPSYNFPSEIPVYKVHMEDIESYNEDK